LTLFLRNATTIDTGAGIDIRNLDDINGGTNDSTQSVQATHTQDNQTRCFDPGTALGTTTVNPWVNQNKGWALPLSDVTPTDDTRCNVVLPAGTATFTFDATVTKAATGVDNTSTFQVGWPCSLWALDLTTNTAVLIAADSPGGVVTWNVSTIGGDAGTYKTITATFTWGGTRTVTNKALTSNVATLTTSTATKFQVGMLVTVSIGDPVFDGVHTITAVANTGFGTTFSYAKVNANVTSAAASGTATVDYVEFPQGSVLFIQNGVNTVTIPNPVTGTTTYTYFMRVDNDNAKIVFDSATGLKQVCREAQSGTGTGEPLKILARARPIEAVNAIAQTSKMVIVVRAIRIVDHVGQILSTRRTRKLPVSTTAVGTTSRAARLRPLRIMSGVGQVTESAALSLFRLINGIGVPSFSRVWTTFRNDSVTATGVPSSTREVKAVRPTQAVGVTSFDRSLILKREDTANSIGVSSRTVRTRPVESVLGIGQTSFSRVLEAFRSDEVNGIGISDFIRRIIFVRLDSVNGIGLMLPGRIELPIDDLPVAAGVPDWPLSTPTHEVRGVTYDGDGDIVSGALVKLFRADDDVLIAETTSDIDGSFSFVRDAADPYEYYVLSRTGVSPQIHGVSDLVSPEPQ
jgi:hypothetical protein